MVLYLYLACFLFLFIPLPKFISNGDPAWDQYLTKDATLPVKGFFVLLVFYRHFKACLTYTGSATDLIFLRLDHVSGQLIVTMFLFYSGYGIYESIKKKGREYVSHFPVRRFLPVWVGYAACVTVYLVANLILGREMELKSVLRAYACLGGIDNPSWYICVTLILYVLVFLCFLGFADREDRGGKLALTVFTFATLAVAVVLFFWRSDKYYNTIFCFVTGMWYSYYKDRIDGVLRKRYWMILGAAACLAVITWFPAMKLAPFYCVHSTIFSLFVVFMTVKLRTGSKVLTFLGNHVFSMYMLQRLPMVVLKGHIPNGFLYFVISFAITVAMALVYDYLAKEFRSARASERSE